MIEGNKINETVRKQEELTSYFMISFLSHGVDPIGQLNFQFLYMDADKIPDSFRCKELEKDGRRQASVVIPFELIPPMWKITTGFGFVEFPFLFNHFNGSEIVKWIDKIDEKSLKKVYLDTNDFNFIKRQLSLLRIFANHFPESNCFVFKTDDLLYGLNEE